MKKIIHIPEPCHEKWGEMSPTEKGKFCKVCTKEVVDFRDKSQVEIISHIEKSENRVCGRFNSKQVGKIGEEPKSIKSQKRNYKFLSKIAASMILMIQFLGLKSFANMGDYIGGFFIQDPNIKDHNTKSLHKKRRLKVL